MDDIEALKARIDKLALINEELTYLLAQQSRIIRQYESMNKKYKLWHIIGGRNED